MSGRGTLLRVLGAAFGWAVIVGNTIGAGILRAPGEVAQAVPSAAAFYGLWLLGGVYALLGALSLAELGAMIPRSGGQTVFVRRAFGPFPGFVVAWGDWLSTCASAAAVTLVLVEAAVVILPELAPRQSVLAVAIVLLFAAVQIKGVRESSAIQLATSALKTIAFGALIIVCFTAGEPAAAAGPPRTVVLNAASVVLALQAIIFTYDGWSGVLYFSGEVENPGRDIPRAMLLGVLSVVAIYLLLNAAFLYLIPLEAAAGDKLVADSAARLVFGRAGTALIRVLIIVSLLSAVNAIILIASRILYAMGATRVNAGGTPVPALLISTAFVLAFVASGTFSEVIAMAAFLFVLNYALSFVSVFKLRSSEPHTPRPYRAWGHPVTTAVALAGSMAFLLAAVAGDPRHSLYAVGLLVFAYPVYRVMRDRLPPVEDA